jgi:5-methylcytosine-specific restriction endonuclease McrA
MEIDHIVPTAAGGEGRWSNYTASCASCNRSKNHRLLLVALLAWAD